MSILRWRLSVALLMIGTCAPLLAQVSDDRYYEGGIFGGVSFLPGDFQFPTLVSGSAGETSRTVGLHYASGYQLGARVAENLNPYWSADLEYTFANQPVRFTNLSPTVPSLSVSQSLHHLTYNVSYLPPIHRGGLEPYAKVGVGAALFVLHGNSQDEAEAALGVTLHDSWKFVFNWGGGVRYVFNDYTTFVFDFKDYMSALPNYGLPMSAQVVNGQFLPGFNPKGVLNSLQLNVGFSFRFHDW